MAVQPTLLRVATRSTYRLIASLNVWDPRFLKRTPFSCVPPRIKVLNEKLPFSTDLWLYLRWRLLLMFKKLTFFKISIKKSFFLFYLLLNLPISPACLPIPLQLLLLLLLLHTKTSTCIHTCIYWGALGVTVVYGHGDPSSDPERGCLYFT